MSSDLKIDLQADDNLENVRRDFVNALASLLKQLALYSMDNDAIRRPEESFWRNLEALRKSSQGRQGVEIKFSEQIFSICGNRVANHFSIVEALRAVPEFMELALIESFTFESEASLAQCMEFFSKWALHCSVNQKPRQLNGSYPGLLLGFLDPAQSSIRLKTKSLMLQPSYALKHYLVLHEATETVFRGFLKQEVLPQRDMRRELFELAEIATVNPYQLVALTLIRDWEDDPDGIKQAVSEAMATSLLSLVMAQRLGFTVREMINTALSGLLYNVGLMSPELAAIIKSNRRLSQTEYQRVLEAHARGVLTLLRAQGATRPVLERLLSLFEATQGAQRLSLSLTLESRLLRLVSAFVALTSDRPFRDAYTAAEAIKLLGSRAASKQEGNLDPVLYYVFVRLMGIYPVGSVVLLSNEKRAVVYRPSGERAGFSLVKLCVSKEDERGSLIDLSMDLGLTILKSLDPKREGIRPQGYFFE